MRYVFYELDDSELQEMELLIKDTSEIAKKLFRDPACNRVELIKKKEQLNKQIAAIVEQQKICGYLDEKEYEGYKSTHLKKSLIRRSQLEELLLAVSDEKGKLYVVLKKAMVAQKNLYIKVEVDE